MTYLEAEAWATAHGLAIDLSVHRDPKPSAAPFDIEAAYCALIENLRAQVEGDVVPLADAPRCAHCVERERRVDSLAAENGRLRASAVWERACEWLLSDDTGLSSETILRFMLGLLDGDAHVPHDASDFGRCLRLLGMFPEWRHRLPELRAEPEWRPLLKIWDRLEILHAGGHHAEIDRMIAKARNL